LQNSDILPDWRRSLGDVPARARIRLSCSDFQVTELLGFVPDGDGEHDFLWIEKEGQNTAWVAEQLAKYAGIRSVDVGYSGLKDRYAVTQHWFSVRRPGGAKPDWNSFQAVGTRVLEATRHGRKLKRGAHRANRFRIAVRDISSPASGVAERLTAIKAEGIPNYFGDQRFGRDAGNLRLAEKLFAGRRLPRYQRSLVLSSARSFLFNLILERRVVDGTWNRLLAGDCANLDGSGSLFAVGVVDDELRQRAARLDIHPTGALWGSGETLVSGCVAALEGSVADRHPAFARGLEKQRVEQARRPLRARVMDLEWRTRDEHTLWLKFTLGRGTFATALLRELVLAVDATPVAM
jgi:tRNA pseudouridine13 synthase